MGTGHEGKFGRCAVCHELRFCFLRFAAVNPRTGRAYHQSYVNVKTGAVNHPWPERGAWVIVCKECRDKTPGLTFERCTWRECGDPRTEYWDLFKEG